jgi:hypothetical protein
MPNMNKSGQKIFEKLIRRARRMVRRNPKKSVQNVENTNGNSRRAKKCILVESKILSTSASPLISPGSSPEIGTGSQNEDKESSCCSSTVRDVFSVSNHASPTRFAIYSCDQQPLNKAAGCQIPSLAELIIGLQQDARSTAASRRWPNPTSDSNSDPLATLLRISLSTPRMQTLPLYIDANAFPIGFCAPPQSEFAQTPPPPPPSSSPRCWVAAPGVDARFVAAAAARLDFAAAAAAAAATAVCGQRRF